MNITSIHVRGRFDATRFAPAFPLLVVSITDPQTDAPTFATEEADVLRLQFHDIDVGRYTYAFDDALPGSDDDLLGCVRDKPMHAFHARQIGPFLRSRLRAGVAAVLVHCEAGVSRSPSIAMAICDRLGLDRAIIDWERDPKRNAPNEHVYNLCCEAMR